MSLGIYEIVIVQGWQIFRYHNNIEGGDSLNHCLEIGEKLNEEMETFLKECVYGNTGVVYVEVKVALISFQTIPPGMRP